MKKLFVLLLALSFLLVSVTCFSAEFKVGEVWLYENPNPFEDNVCYHILDVKGNYVLIHYVWSNKPTRRYRDTKVSWHKKLFKHVATKPLGVFGEADISACGRYDY